MAGNIFKMVHTKFISVELGSLLYTIEQNDRYYWIHVIDILNKKVCLALLSLSALHNQSTKITSIEFIKLLSILQLSKVLEIDP